MNSELLLPVEANLLETQLVNDLANFDLLPEISLGSSLNGNGASYPSVPCLLGKFQRLLERHRDERHVIVIQDFPDPDALSSSWAYQLIAEQYGIQCDIVYAGTLSHQENIALVKLTGLPAKRWGVQTLKDRDLSVYQGCVLMDSQDRKSVV